MPPKSQEVFQQELEILRRAAASAKGPQDLVSSTSLLLVRWSPETAHPTEGSGYPLDHSLIAQRSFSQQRHWRDCIPDKECIKDRLKNFFRRKSWVHGFTGLSTVVKSPLPYFLTSHSVQNALVRQSSDFAI